jgi:hypothetical protein
VDAVSRLALTFVGTLLLAVPGLLAARAFAPRGRDADPSSDAIGRVVVGLGWGFAVVPTLAFFLCLATGWRVSWGSLLLASLGAAALPAARLVRGGAWRDLLPSPARVHADLAAIGGALAGAAAIGLVYVLKYDTRFAGADSCIYTAAFTATGLRDPGVDLLRTSIENARLGNPGVMAAYLVVYGASGFRVLFGVLGVLLALGGYLVGRAVGGSRGWGLAGLLLLPLNPYVASIPQLDENLLALGLGSTVLPFVVAGTTGWGAAGVFFGLVVLCRHVMLPALPALLLVAWQSPERARGAVRLLAGFVAITFFENLHHALALGSVFQFESLPQYPLLAYRILGLDVSWQGLLNWPIHDTLVRTPHNPFPMLVAWPLHLADTFGTLLFAAMAVGAVTIWRVARRQACFWALWSGVFLAGIVVQESWDHLNKMGLLIVAAGAFVAWTLAGLAWVVRRPRYGVPIVAVFALALPPGAAQLRDWRAPADARYQALPAASPELPSQLDLDARRATELGLLPDVRRVTAQGTILPGVLPGLRWELALGAPDLAPRPWGFVPGTTPDRGPPVTLELDLAADPLKGPVLASTTLAPDLDLTTGAALVRVEGPAVPWADGPVTLFAGVGPELTAFVLYLGDEPPEAADPAPGRARPGKDRSWERRKIWAMMAGVEPPAEGVGQRLQAPRAVVRVRLPAGAVSFGLEKNLRGGRMLQWRGTVGAAGARLEGPWDLWHN